MVVTSRHRFRQEPYFIPTFDMNPTSTSCADCWPRLTVAALHGGQSSRQALAWSRGAARRKDGTTVRLLQFVGGQRGIHLEVTGDAKAG